MSDCDDCPQHIELSNSKHELRVQEFALAVYRYCRAVGGSVTSWVRTAEHNKAVGGVVNSFHLRGLAADIRFDGSPRFEPHERAALANGYGLRLIVEGDHDHLQART